jgi:hypothetical protein
MPEPKVCAYTRGACREVISRPALDYFFIYPSEQNVISETIRNSVTAVRKSSSLKLSTWEDMGATGQIILCEVCNPPTV